MSERMTNDRFEELQLFMVGLDACEADSWRRKLRRELWEALKAERAAYSDKCAEVERLEAKLERIRPFVQHQQDCMWRFPMHPPQGFHRNACSCGMGAALADPEQEKGDE